MQLKHFNFSDEDDAGFKNLNHFLEDDDIIVKEIQCNNNGYGSHVYVMYEKEIVY